jgi:hypothetical protein
MCDVTSEEKLTFSQKHLDELSRADLQQLNYIVTKKRRETNPRSRHKGRANERATGQSGERQPGFAEGRNCTLSAGPPSQINKSEA